MEHKNEQLDSEEQILAAAIAIFQRDGFDGARMLDIADTAKINKALLHYYYRSKEKLFQSVFNLLFKKLMKEMGDVMDSNASLEDKIRMFFHKHISFMMLNPYMPGFIISELNRNPQLVINAMKESSQGVHFKGFVTQLKTEIEAGLIQDVDPLQLFVNMLSLSVFPFGARGMLMSVFNLDKEAFEKFVEQRKSLCAELIISSIKIKQ